MRRRTKFLNPASGLISVIQLVCRFRLIRPVSSESGEISESPRFLRGEISQSCKVLYTGQIVKLWSTSCHSGDPDTDLLAPGPEASRLLNDDANSQEELLRSDGQSLTHFAFQHSVGKRHNICGRVILAEITRSKSFLCPRA